MRQSKTTLTGGVKIHCQYPLRAPLFGFKGKKSIIGADIQYGLSAQVLWKTNQVQQGRRIIKTRSNDARSDLYRVIPIDGIDSCLYLFVFQISSSPTRVSKKGKHLGTGR